MSSEDFPSELAGPVKNLHNSLSDLDTSLRVMTAVPRSELQERLDPLDRAKIDLVSAYAINSLFWMLLRTLGENPKDGDVKKELDRFVDVHIEEVDDDIFTLRVREAMGRVKQLQDKARRPRQDQEAAKRMIASGLWKPGEAKMTHGGEREERGGDRKRMKH